MGALTAELLAANLVADLTEIEGQDVTVGGATILVTTETAIVQWTALRLHGKADSDTISCCCGWRPDPAVLASWQITALDRHMIDARAAMLAGIGSAP
jgi:hypothetical protein